MKERSNRIKQIVLAVSLVVVLFCAIGVTYAILNTKTEMVKNAFNGKMVNIVVTETVKEKDLDVDNATLNYGNISEEPVSKIVKIKNLNSPAYPTTDTYVRVRMVPVLRYEGSQNTGEAVAQQIQVQYTFGQEDTKWRVQTNENGESYYYYPKLVKAGEQTTPLITAMNLKSGSLMPNGSYLELEVLADGIQARPKTAIEDAWSISIEEILKLPEVQ
ncbi:MAG: hypothetical protein RR275_00105 [Lachnospiraceae bacterium]